MFASSAPGVRITANGFSVLHDPETAIADIVFVHGLKGHPRNTWVCKKTEPQSQGSKETSRIRKFFSRERSNDDHILKDPSIFWPLDLLPEDCPNSRVLTWGYDSQLSHFFGGAANQNNIAAYARDMLRGLKHIRRDCERRSIIFIAHSLGGIIVKDVLTRAANDVDLSIQDIYVSTKAILFLGTPHRGSGKAAIGEVVRKIVSASGFDTADQNIRALHLDSSELERIHEDFIMLYERRDRRFRLFTFQETKGVVATSLFKLNERVTLNHSSTLGLGGEIRQTINADHRSMCRFSSKDDEGYKKILSEIQTLISEIQKKPDEDEIAKNRDLNDLKAGSPSQATTHSTTYSFNDEERKCILLLTQNSVIASKHKSSIPSHVEGTCEWILLNPNYLNWKMQKEPCLLWISGYPGCGKTILSAYLIDHLNSRTTLCSFFCVDRISTQRDGTAILRSLIHQLILRHRSLITYVKAMNDIYIGQFDQDFNELWKTFIKMACDKRVGPLSVIVDAIDECEETTRNEFLRAVSNLTHKPRFAGSRQPCIKFLVTSRPLLDRAEYTAMHLHIDPSQDHVDQDLKLVIQTKVNGIARRTQCGSDVKAYLENALYSRADRTFLWVHLVLHLLEDSYLASQEDFKRIIDELPKTLTETYERFLEIIPISKQKVATKLLCLIIGSPRPLTLDEMRIMFAVEDHHHSLAAVEKVAQPNIQMTIEKVLGPLVRISEGQIYLVHQSLKDFLLNLSTQTDSPLSAIFGVDPLIASLEIAKACISYLLLYDFNQDLFDFSRTEESPTSLEFLAQEDTKGSGDPYNLGEDNMFWDSGIFEEAACRSITQRYSFFDYSARHWAGLFSTACSISPPDVRKSVLLLSDISTPQGSNWFHFYWYHEEKDLEYPRDFVPILVASYFGHSTSLSLLMEAGLTFGSGIEAYGLYWASRMGHCDVVDLLLRERVNIDILVHGQHALIAAIQFNRLDVVKRFLKEEGFISEEKGYLVNHPRVGRRTPLSIAAGNGHVSIVRLLLQHGQIQPDIPDSDLWTPLFWSVSAQSLDILQELISDNRISVNSVDKRGRNVLSWAAETGELEIVKYLMTLEKLKANEEDGNGRTALSWAAGNGQLETTIFLRRSLKIDISRKDNDGRNALSWACERCHDDVIKYLIKHDPNGVDAEDGAGWAPLAWTLFKESPSTVKLLLDSGLVDVNKKDNAGRSALSLAASYGYLEVVQLLLKTEGIEIESMDRDGRTPLSHATRYPDVIQALQEASP